MYPKNAKSMFAPMCHAFKIQPRLHNSVDQGISKIVYLPLLSFQRELSLFTTFSAKLVWRVGHVTSTIVFLSTPIIITLWTLRQRNAPQTAVCREIEIDTKTAPKFPNFLPSVVHVIVISHIEVRLVGFCWRWRGWVVLWWWVGCGIRS